MRSLLCALMVACNFFAAAQSGSIKGKITTSDDEPAEYINVILKGTNKGATTNKEGFFEIRNVEPGDHSLIISFFGLEEIEHPVYVRSGVATDIKTIVLKKDAQELNEVIVQDYKSNPFSREKSEYVAKLPLKNIENPQVYNVISAELLKSQVVTNFDDALKNAPGIYKLWESTGRGVDGAGYFSLRGFAVQPTMVNGLPGLTNGGLDPVNIERVEVIKGPSGTLYGSSLISYGGLINVVTKKPYEGFGGEIGYTTGSFNLNRITADINTPLSKDGNATLRINGAFHNENSFQDAGYNRSYFIAPSLSYKVSERLSFLINAEYLSSDRTNPTMLFFDRGVGLQVTNLKDLGYNSNLSFTSNDLAIKNPTFTVQAEMRYKLSDNWTSQTVVSRSNAQTNGYYTYLYETSQYFPADLVFSRYISKQNSSTSTTDIQQNFIGDFKIGNFRNRIVAGLDLFNRKTTNNNSAYIGYGKVAPQQNYYDNPTDSTDNVAPPLTQAGVDAALASASLVGNIAEQRVYSAYVSDVFNFNPRLSAMVSLRIDHFDNPGEFNPDLQRTEGEFNQTALSPKFGLVYQPVLEKVSIFTNYMNGFSNVAPVEERINSTSRTKSFEPERANQWEIGTKVSLLDNKIAATVSYYDITVSNVVRTISIPSEDSDAPDDIIYAQDGENYSQGFETEILANPLAGLNIIAGYSYNESKVVKTSSEDFLGRRPEEAGPKHLANLWVNYQFIRGRLSGVGIGFGGNYASENRILDRATTGVFSVPAYTVLNASVSYNAPKYRLAFKLNNLTDENYFLGWSTLNPQKPINFLASFAFKF